MISHVFQSLAMSLKFEREEVVNRFFFCSLCNIAIEWI